MGSGYLRQRVLSILLVFCYPPDQLCFNLRTEANRTMSKKVQLESPMNWQIRCALILFLAISSSSCTLLRQYDKGYLVAQEISLREVLAKMREGISKYTQDKGQPPQTLRELVEQDYLNHIPRDPITNQANWTVVMYECPATVDCRKGIKDVHSASAAKSTQGNTYAEW
jgi:hypothetical protein